MNKLIIILVMSIMFLGGCTSINYNAATKEFSYISTKECEKCELSFKKGDTEITIKIGSLKAFGSQVAGTLDSYTGVMDKKLGKFDDLLMSLK